MNEKQRLNILHLEDEPDFAELVCSLLEQGGVAADVRRVGNRAAFAQALEDGTFDLIISDYHLPSFTGLEAMALAKKKFPHTPFILVSGTIGEQAAIESLKAGATDYVLKQQPDRLPSAVRRAVREAAERAKLREAELELVPPRKIFPHVDGKFARRGRDSGSRTATTLISARPSKHVLGYPNRLSWLGEKRLANCAHPDDVPEINNYFEGPWKTRPVGLGAISLPAQGRSLASPRGALPEPSGRPGHPRHGGAFPRCDRPLAARRRICARAKNITGCFFKAIRIRCGCLIWRSLKFLEVNEAAIQHYGYSREEFLAMTIMDIRPAEKNVQQSNLRAGHRRLAGVWSGGTGARTAA